MPPLSLLDVFGNQGFIWLVGLCFLVMACASRLDVAISGSRVAVLSGRLDNLVRDHVVAWFRYALAAFFCAALIYFGAEPVFLTPELRTSAEWVAPLQAGIAMALMQRSSAWLGSLGIVVLYGFSVDAYGWFHLLDYPVFLGAAAFIAIDSIWQGRKTDTALAVLRASAGVTLMWASAEKWLYPWWSYPLLDGELKGLRAGFSASFFVMAAGCVEFCAAYALVFGRVSVQLAAGILLIPFVAAVAVFGELDAIGHAPIVAVLVVLGVTRNRVPIAEPSRGAMCSAVSHAVSCTLSAAAMLGLYWGLQAQAYPAASQPGMVVVAVLLCLPLLLWTLPQLRVVLQGPDNGSRELLARHWIRRQEWFAWARSAPGLAWQRVQGWLALLGLAVRVGFRRVAMMRPGCKGGHVVSQEAQAPAARCQRRCPEDHHAAAVLRGAGQP